MSVEIGIIEAEARTALQNAKTLDEKINAAFSAAKNHWMFTDENAQFKGAIGAIYTHATDEEKNILNDELHNIKLVNAMLSGVPVDLGGLIEMDKPLHLMERWRNYCK